MKSSFAPIDFILLSLIIIMLKVMDIAFNSSVFYNLEYCFYIVCAYYNEKYVKEAKYVN